MYKVKIFSSFAASQKNLKTDNLIENARELYP